MAKITSRDITYNLHKVIFSLDKLGDKTLQDSMDLTFSQFRVMMAIENGGICQKHIADYWDMTEAAVSRQLEMLVEKEFVERVENSENRRQNLLKISKKGLRIYQKALLSLDEAYEKVYGTLNEKEREMLLENLHKLLKVICTKSSTDPIISCK